MGNRGVLVMGALDVWPRRLVGAALLGLTLSSGCSHRRAAAIHALNASAAQRQAACAAARDRSKAAMEAVNQADLTVRLAETALAESATRRGERPRNARRGLLYDEAVLGLERAQLQFEEAKEQASRASALELDACTGI